MIEIIAIEYVINLALLLYFYMHMFQLNSYFFKKQMHWMKKNITKVLIQLVLVIIPTMVLLILKNKLANIITLILLAISIIYNLPKGKSKRPLKITSRVKRMFFT